MIRGLFFLLTHFLLLSSFLIANEKEEEKPIDLRGVKVWVQQKKIEIRGVVNMDEGVVELLATSPDGKKHESVLVLTCNPALLHTSILLIGKSPGGGEGEQGSSNKPLGDLLYIYVKWEEDNKTIIRRGEELIWNEKQQKEMNKTAWIFTGSRFSPGSDKRKTVYMANVTGVLVATYYDPEAIVNNPLPTRTDDTTYHANKKKLPPLKTPVTLIITAEEQMHSDTNSPPKKK